MRAEYSSTPEIRDTIYSDMNQCYIGLIDDHSRASDETLINGHKQTQSIAMNQTGRAEIQFSLSAHFSPN